MEYLYCESHYGGGEGYENWHAPKPRREEFEQSGEDEIGHEEIINEPASEAMETISHYEELMKLWADIIERGPSWDPALLAAKRQDIQNLLAILGVLDDNGQCDTDKLIGLSIHITSLKENPIKPNDYPDIKKFKNGVVEAIKNNPKLFEDLRGRSGKELKEYLYGLGIILTSEIVYRSIFENDPISKGRDGSIQNGRHRVAARESLENCGFYIIEDWIEEVVEK